VPRPLAAFLAEDTGAPGWPLGRHEPGRTTASAARRDRRVRHLASTAPEHEAGHHGAVAGGGPARPSFDRWVERDLAYIGRWSLLLDFKILLRTVPAVAGRTGR